MRRKQTTLKGIAEILGVSHTTVSRALKDHPDISEEMKIQVQQLAKELNYHPNNLAVNLRKNQSSTIGVIIPEISFYFFPSVLKGIEEVAHNMGYNVMIMQSNESLQREKENVSLLLGNRIAGLLVSVSYETKEYSHFDEIENAGIPIVFFDKVVEQKNIFKVDIDGIKAAREGTTHLIESGFKNIVLLAGNPNMSISIDRIKGYKQALEANGMDMVQENILYANNLDEAEFVTQQVISRRNRPDAIFTISDQNLSGALQAIKKAGLTIPDDIAILSFSDGPLTTIMNPSISSIKHSGYQIGNKAASLLFYRIQNPEQALIPIVQILETELVIRESTRKRQGTKQ
ncbi:MAG: LacI family DNA-binding transcriptional regulator [Bacteroidales bacterium]|nr:LacI family DNA-binding transcriptional regulator [Bacteroidales bacterium]